MSTVRLRRLQADYQQLRAYVNKHPRLQLIQAEGEPPERYQLEYHINSLRQQDADLKEVKSHLVEISLPRNYPRTPPLCRMLTPIFHPNIAPHAICIGDHWSAGEPLQSIVARIGELIAYQSYNVKSPLKRRSGPVGDGKRTRLPLDSVSMLVEDGAAPTNGAPTHGTAVKAPAATAPANPAAAAIPAAASTIFACTGCQAKIRVTPERAGKRVRCPQCSTILTLPLL